MSLARKSIFKLSKMVLFENRKVADSDELGKSKRDEQWTFSSARMLYMTQVVTNYKGFKISSLISENQVGENHEKSLKNDTFQILA